MNSLLRGVQDLGLSESNMADRTYGRPTLDVEDYFTTTHIFIRILGRGSDGTAELWQDNDTRRYVVAKIIENEEEAKGGCGICYDEETDEPVLEVD
ncbi:hypothetical protein LTS18_009912, partial [Coniosporium uncinatum]